jgi:long-chain acyl-CoA synthetase
MFLKDHHKTALLHGDREISYTELIAAADGYARLLTLAPGDRAAVFSENRPEWIY